MKPLAGGRDRDRFIAIGSADDVYVRAREDRTILCLRGLYRMFAVWVDTGPQPGVHVRGEAGTRSTAFRGTHNWIYLDAIDWEALPAQLALAKTIAAKRGAGIVRALDVYQPLAKAVAAARVKPAVLHAGGPRAKVVSGERDLAVAICKRCLERLAHLARDGEGVADWLAFLARDERTEAWWAEWKARRDALFEVTRTRPGGSAAQYALACMLAAANAGSQSCLASARGALLRTVSELEATESPEDACAFLVEIDELIMKMEFAAAMTKHVKQTVAIERVLWRGSDAKGFPAWWVVRIDAATYGLLGKLGKRWTWTVDARDAVLATVPDELLDEAVEIALARDA